MLYETSLKDKWDRQNQLDFAVEKAVEKTIEDERAKAALALKEAEAKAKEEKLSIARNFKQLNISAVDIAKATGLSTEEVERL